jgi:hypothetical protein
MGKSSYLTNSEIQNSCGPKHLGQNTLNLYDTLRKTTPAPVKTLNLGWYVYTMSQPQLLLAVGVGCATYHAFSRPESSPSQWQKDMPFDLQDPFQAPKLWHWGTRGLGDTGGDEFSNPILVRPWPSQHQISHFYYSHLTHCAASVHYCLINAASVQLLNDYLSQEWNKVLQWLVQHHYEQKIKNLIIWLDVSGEFFV